MPKKKRKQTQRKSLFWPLVALGGALLIVAALLLANSGGDSGGTPAIAVDQQLIDLGTIKNNTNMTFAIKVTNTGTGTLRFTEPPYIEVLEGCCPPRLTIGSMALKPGESTVIRSSVFMMHEGMDGPHDFAVHLKTNDPQNPDLVVHVLSNWVP